MLPTIKVIIRADKPNKAGLCPLAFRITLDRVNYFFYVKHSVDPVHFDKQLSCVVKSAPNAAIINEILTSTHGKLLRLFNDGKHPKEAIEQLTNPIKPAEHASTLARTTPLFYSYFRDHIESLKQTNRLGYAHSFTDTLRAMMRYHEVDLRAERVDHLYLEGFEQYHLKAGLQLNSVYVYMRNIKVVVNLLRKRGEMPWSWYPFRNFSFGKYTQIETRKRALSEAELHTFINCKPIDANMQLAHDLFMFSYYSRGINLVDMVSLKEGNLREDRLLYKRQKTSKLFDIKLLPPAIAILDRYRGMKAGNDYLFGLLDDKKHITAVQIKNRNLRINKQVNAALGQLASMC